MISKNWTHCIVAATGPSLTPEQAALCKGHNTIVVNDAWELLPWADVLYACDEAWWIFKSPGTQFAGERWSSHDLDPTTNNNKLAAQARFGLKLIDGKDEQGFSTKPGVIHYGGNSGFQGVGLALQFGAKNIILIGFDAKPHADGREHFFGSHPDGFAQVGFSLFASSFHNAKTPPGVRIVNATPGSAITCYPRMPLADALKEWECAPAHIAAG